jgi:luciferase family oxidoreductase group 1
MTLLSVLDLVPVSEGQDASHALANALDLARTAEACGYHRYWVAEHHNMIGIASAATAVVIAHLGSGTKTIRLGAGGIMLPNHAPLVIAEQFGTLEALFPKRIDLGIGRAPGTDQRTMHALRRTLMSDDQFPQDVMELQQYFEMPSQEHAIKAVPGYGLNVPLYILGSSLYGAQLAGMMGLPYAFASHFAPDALMSALATYQHHFKASEQQQSPHAMAGVNVVLAETDEEARFLFTSIQQRFADMVRGRRGKLKPPIENIETYWNDMEKMQASRMLACSFVGSPATVEPALRAFIAQTEVDELIVASALFDHEARKKSYQLLAGLDLEIATPVRHQAIA